MNIPGSVSTPKPYGNKAPDSFVGAHPLATLFMKQAAPLVTPELPQREVIFAGLSHNGENGLLVTPEGRQASRQVVTEALAMAQGGFASPRETKRALAPRPGKLFAVIFTLSAEQIMRITPNDPSFAS